MIEGLLCLPLSYHCWIMSINGEGEIKGSGKVVTKM